MATRQDAARAAYPDIPLFRYGYTDLSLAEVSRRLTAPALAGPQSLSPSDDLAGETLRFRSENGPSLDFNFSPERRVEVGGAETAYGALTLDHVTLVTMMLPREPRAYALAWDRHDNRATLFELWFGNGPAPVAREVNRELWHGYIDTGAGAPQAELHAPTARCEGRACMWAEDTGNRTVDYYPSSAFSHWVELDRLEEGRGYSAPSDYIKLTEDLYLYTRTEAEFSGLWHMYVMDANRLEQVGLRLGFNGLDELEYYMFRGNGEWLGQLARFQTFGDVSGDPLAFEDAAKGERRIYRPLRSWDTMTEAEVREAMAAHGAKVFERASPMAGHGLPPSDGLAGRTFAVRYDNGPRMEYRFTSADELQWRENGGGWTTARYNAWQNMPGVFIFGHYLEGKPDYDGHIVVADLETGKASAFRGYLNTPYFANEAGAETWFGKLEGEGIPDPGEDRHERTLDLLGRAFTWSYSPGLTSMHLYSSPNTVSWIIFTPSQHGGSEWSGSGDFVKIRDELYFVRWQEEACNGTLGTILINMRTMHDSGISYHMGEEGLSMGPVGAYARHAGHIGGALPYLSDKPGGHSV
ncbi:MoaF N-terminal domain-containing protein [Aurantiacibacter hainanensis]|uniref:MoaF N-terminal domain-containing protein n=1 Tax=Aurantiacibacter hainanensis TaxID=3076114 RepID=UPI0030C732AD